MTKKTIVALGIAASLFLGISTSYAANVAGYVDVIDCNTIQGWAYDPDSPSSKTAVHIYVDGPYGGGGTFLLYGETTVSRPDVNAYFGITGTHGFKFTMPSAVKDNFPHTIIVYGIDTSNAGPNLVLNGSGKSVTCTPSGSNIYDPLVFQWEFYLDANSDLRKAGITAEAQAKTHWNTQGKREGRRASANFDVKYYLNNNADILKLYGVGNYYDALLHFLHFGQFESGRKLTAPYNYGWNFGKGQATFGNEAVTIRTFDDYSGTVSEIWYKGKQVENNNDAGRLFQTAVQLNDLGEGCNPTEGGTLANVSGPSSSVLQALSIQPAKLNATTKAAYWLPLTSAAIQGGCVGSVGSVLSNVLITKEITVGALGDPNIIHWRSHVTLDKGYKIMKAESLTGYLNGKDFPKEHVYTFNPATRQLTPAAIMRLKDPVETSDWNNFFHMYPRVFSSADGKHAMGVFPLDQPRSGAADREKSRVATFGAFYWNNGAGDYTTKWSVHFFYAKPIPAGHYTYDTYIILGTREEVRQKLTKLYADHSNETLSLVSGSNGKLGYDDAFYKNQDAGIAALSPEFRLRHFFWTDGNAGGMEQGRSGSALLNAKIYLNRYPDLQTAYGPANLLDAFKHFIRYGDKEGRDGN